MDCIGNTSKLEVCKKNIIHPQDAPGYFLFGVAGTNQSNLLCFIDSFICKICERTKIENNYKKLNSVSSISTRFDLYGLIKSYRSIRQ